MSDKLENDVLKEVLTKAMAKEILTTNYPEALAFTLQDFSVGALLPAMFYMFRRGHRRGQGNFADQFAPITDEMEFKRSKTKKAATVASVTRILTQSNQQFSGFETPVAQNILADFLLTHCLENQRHEPGRKKPVIRAFPTHYQSAWMDLPSTVADLRLVPESLVAILADQSEGETVSPTASEESFFRVNDDFSSNILLAVFASGMSTREQKSNLVDEFEENTKDIGLDQLATIRVARMCEQPKKLKKTRSRQAEGHGRGSSEIANQQPLAKEATRAFREDIGIFLKAFGKSVPRQSLTKMLEACIGLGLTNIILSTSKALLEFERTGVLAKPDTPWPLVVDCSGGTDNELRLLSEEMTDDMIRRMHRLPVVLMALRILEHHARYEINDLPPKRPDATARVDILGEILTHQHEDSKMILRDIRKHCMKLADRFKEEEIGEPYIGILEDEASIPNPVLRLAEALTQLMGDRQQIRHVLACLSSSMMTGSPHGLAAERRVRFQTMRNGKKTGMMKSMLLTDTMLDFLVHRHLPKPGRGGNTKSNSISFNDFVTLLRERYGLLVDQAPPGETISRELLQRNRRCLERRLRSLGLLVGVNDAESMKRLRPRFHANDNDKG